MSLFSNLKTLITIWSKRTKIPSIQKVKSVQLKQYLTLWEKEACFHFYFEDYFTLEFSLQVQLEIPVRPLILPLSSDDSRQLLTIDIRMSRVNISSRSWKYQLLFIRNESLFGKESLLTSHSLEFLFL